MAAVPPGGWGVNLPLQEGNEEQEQTPTTEDRTSANTDGDPPAIWVDVTLTNHSAPASGKPQPASPLPRLTLPPGRRDQIHGIVWEVARLFGFQTFNKAPLRDGGDPDKVQWTPAGAFVAADHLTSLLLQGVLRLRGPRPTAAGVLPEDTAFIQAVFQLHSSIFHSYGAGWCPLVRLHPIPKALLERRDKVPALSPEACHMLLCELALYFLIWTEAANVRHMPEAMWFLWWCCAHTVAFTELCCSSGMLHVPAVGQGPAVDSDLREQRVRCRNAYQAAIAGSHREAGFDPSKQLPSACFPADRQQRSAQMPGMLAAADTIAAYLATEGRIPVSDLAVATELALNGDGGFWMGHIITPIFLLLAQEMESLHFEEHFHRLGYDDVNESFSNHRVVHAVLNCLGVPSSQRKDAVTNSAFTAIAVWIGSPRCLALMGKTFGGASEQQRWLTEAATACSGGAPTEQWFLPTRAAAFWSAELATKTFQERRSWLAIYRAYYRIFLINLVAFHIMMAQALTESWDWQPISTAVLTHAGLQALERYANWHISNTSTSKTQSKDKARFGISRTWLLWGRHRLPAPRKRDAEDPVASDLIPSDFRATRLLRKAFHIEGAPIWGIFGFIEWVILFAGLVTLYVMQLYAPDYFDVVVTRDQLAYAWKWTALGYAGLAGLHFVLTTRPGYCVSLSHSLYMPGIVRASSCRPDPNCWVAGSLSVNFGSWLWQVITWSMIWAAKWAFEFFLVARPLALEIHSLLEFNICDTYLNRSGMCIDISYLLVVVTMAPFLCLVLTDGMVAYHAYLTITCLCASILRLNYASLPEWDECVREFHRAPARWWNKCMSGWGRDAAKHDTDVRYQPTRYASHSGTAGDAPSRPTTASTTAAAEMARLGTIRRAITRGVAADLEKTAQFEAFSMAWDALVNDLREGDLLTDSESHNCSFARLHPEGHGWTEWPEAAVFVGPVVLPAFFFAGQVQRVVDTGRVTAVQGAVLEQMRSLGLLLAVDLGLLSGAQASAVQACPFIAKPTNHEHLEARAKTLPAAVKLVTALLNVSQGKATPADGAKGFTDALRTVTEGLEVECRAAGGLSTHNESSWRNNIKRLGQKSQKAALALDVLLELQQAARSTGALTECLKPLVPPKPGTGIASRPHGVRMGPGAPPSSSPLARELVQVLHAMLTVPSTATCPGNSEAQRIISTFLNSLSLGSLAKAPSLTETRSLTTLTPLYGEDVMYCLEAEEAAKNLKLGGADPAAAARGMTDLLTPPGLGSSSWEQQGAVTLLTYLRGVYPSDWDNFRERIARLALAAADAATKAANGDGEPDSQVPAGVKPERIKSHLKRGFRAIHDYDFRAGGVLAPWALELQLWASFRAQVLARTARGMVCCDRAIKVLTQLEHPRPVGMSSQDYQAWVQQMSETKYNYLVAAQAYGKQRASSDLKDRWQAHCIEVLLGKYSAMRVAYLDVTSASVLIRAARDGSGGIEEVYRVRLPTNPYNGGRGVVVGEGKPENQNHANIFAFGEALQTVDMNQDGCLAEALKTRNLLAELSPVHLSKDVWSGSRSSRSRPANRAPTALEVLRGLRSVRLNGPTPTAICGFKEWIFSHKAGALASFAASTEYAFATIIQSDMARGNVRLHYGHPDVFDKLHCMTRGGVSKATRGLHVSEDVLGGLNHVLRGGKVKYTEAISCGKGRDMGFNSVLQFELKISSGNAEVMLTRDLARLAPRMDLWRLLHFYHSGLGYFVTARMLMLGIYCQALALAAVSLAGHELVNTNIQLTIQIGLVSSLPYIAQLIFETGIFNATLVFFKQLIAGVVAFTIFRMQTTAYYFTTDIMYGGASYIQTGRGFSYRPSSFVQLYASYGRSHIFLGFELGLLGVVIAACGTAGGDYGALTWGIWLVAASLMVAPIWFNPLTFNMDNVAKDWVQWKQWLQGEKDPEVQSSWSTWNRKQLAKFRDDAGQQEGHWQVALMGVAIDSVPKLILGFIAATRLTSDTSVYLLLTMALWVLVWMLLWLRNVLLDTVRLKTWARMRTFLAITAIALPIAFVVVVTRLYSEGANHLFLTLYVHLMTLLALHGAAIHLCSGLSSLGALVNDGLWLLDCVSGTLLLSVVALLSIGGLFEKLQAVLLFNRNFARSIKDSKTSRLFAQWKPSTQGNGPDDKGQDEQTSQQLKEAASVVGAQAAAAQAPTLRNNALTLLTQGTLRLKGLIRGAHSSRPQTPTHADNNRGSAGPSSPAGPGPAHIPSDLPLTAGLLPGQTPPAGSPLTSLASSMRASIRRASRYAPPPTGEITPMVTSRLATSTSLGVELPRPRWEEASKNFGDRRQL